MGWALQGARGLRRARKRRAEHFQGCAGLAKRPLCGPHSPLNSSKSTTRQRKFQFSPDFHVSTPRVIVIVDFVAGLLSLMAEGCPSPARDGQEMKTTHQAWGRLWDMAAAAERQPPGPGPPRGGGVPVCLASTSGPWRQLWQGIPLTGFPSVGQGH